MGDARFIGRAAFDADADKERAVEPPSVLIMAFDVDIRGPGKVGSLAEHGMTRSRLEPDIEDVVFFRKLPGTALGAASLRGQKLRGAPLIPGVGAFTREDIGDAQSDFFRGQNLAARIAVERRDGHAPAALAEIHQSGRPLIMLAILSSPQGGIQRTLLISSRAFFLKSFLSIEINHWAVARKITGFLQRQQCG